MHSSQTWNTAGVLQGQFWRLLDSLEFANFGNFLQKKVSTFGNFWKKLQSYSTAKNFPVLTVLSSQKSIFGSKQKL